jgi:hypothetical protein
MRPGSYPTTGGVHKTRDIIWLKRMYFPKVSLDPPADGDDIKVTITIKHSSIEAREGEQIYDSDTTEVETMNIIPFTMIKVMNLKKMKL